MPDPQHISEKAEYERFGDDHLEQCPVCGTCISPAHHSGRAVLPTGLREAEVYDSLMDSDPADGPFYCGECWDRHRIEVAQETHRTLSEFGTEDRVYYGE